MAVLWGSRGAGSGVNSERRGTLYGAVMGREMTVEREPEDRQSAPPCTQLPTTLWRLLHRVHNVYMGTCSHVLMYEFIIARRRVGACRRRVPLKTYVEVPTDEHSNVHDRSAIQM